MINEPPLLPEGSVKPILSRIRRYPAELTRNRHVHQLDASATLDGFHPEATGLPFPQPTFVSYPSQLHTPAERFPKAWVVSEPLATPCRAEHPQCLWATKPTIRDFPFCDEHMATSVPEM